MTKMPLDFSADNKLWIRFTHTFQSYTTLLPDLSAISSGAQSDKHVSVTYGGGVYSRREPIELLMPDDAIR